MQWIFMLVGLVLGAVADETLTASLLGALLGLGLGQALRLHGLERENAALQAQLKTFAERNKPQNPPPPTSAAPQPATTTFPPLESGAAR